MTTRSGTGKGRRKSKSKRKSKTTRRVRRQRRSKKYKGGDPEQLDPGTIQQADYDPYTMHAHSVRDAVKELIEKSYEIYSDVLASSAGGTPRTIICGGQSPAYFCLAMTNFKIYDPASANILVLPFSKESDRSSSGSGAGAGSASAAGLAAAAMYCDRLKEKGIRPYENIVIIDYIESGEGVSKLLDVLQFCYKGYFKTIKIIAVNDTNKLDSGPLSKYEKGIYATESVMQFSERFKRLVPQYPPSKFGDSGSLTTDFTIAGNPLAEMIIDLASVYEGPDGPKIEETQWYILNEGVF
jgi:hypothetical protein